MMMMIRPSMLLLFSLSLLSLLLSVSYAEIREFNGLIEANSQYIHYSEGYIVAPGSIDLSKLTFTTVDDDEDDEDWVEDGGIDAAAATTTRAPAASTTEDEDDDAAEDMPGDEKDSGGDRNRSLMDPSSFATTSNTVDIVFFNEPKECSNSRRGCDWTELGIGASDGNGGVRWCCSNDAIANGYCSASDKNQYGRLIVNATLFSGQHRFLDVPAMPGTLDHASIHYGLLEEPTVSGKYNLVIVNCNDEGRTVMVEGKYAWKSSHGYLPGDLFGELVFFGILTMVYLMLALGYGLAMRKFDDASIPIQKWILGTIVLGLLETFFRTGDYLVWNEDGQRFWFAMYTGVLVGVIKRGLSRCLIVMVSLGWGVVRDQLDQMMAIRALGLAYVSTAAARDILTILAVTENETLSINEEKELFDAVTIITFVVAAIDVTFYMWIIDALNGTMQYLENMNQRIKLQRYLTLRLILLFSILFALVWSIFSLVNTYTADEDASILEEQQEWAVGALMEINYLLMLIGVAYLWRPNPNAKDLAYVMELPALGGDDDDEGNELEMTSNIPSALDYDDENDEEDDELGMTKDDDRKGELA